MKALVYTQPEEMTFRDEPDPEPAADEVLIKVEAAGICGSDMHAYHGHDERRIPPLILGHEAAGTIVSGPGTGRRVVVNPLMTCGQCDYCLGGRSNLCRSRQIIGMTPREGAFAEYLRMPERNLVTLPEGMDPVHASVTEPVATSLHTIHLAARAVYRPLAELRSLVIGAGAVGLAAALILRHQGCTDLSIGDTNDLRRKTAERAGVGAVYDPRRETLEDASFDLVIDAVGGEVTRKVAVEAVKPGGVVMHIGLMDSAGGLDIRKITLQEVTFIGTYTYTMVDFRATVAMLNSGALGSLDWIEQRPLAEGGAAFQDIDRGSTPAAKIVLSP